MRFRMIRQSRVLLFFVVCFAAAIPAVPQEPPAASAAALNRIEAAFTGDLPQIIERRQLRVLVSYSLSNYFLDLGTEHGFEYELLSKYGEELNQGRSLSKRIVVAFIPVPLENLLDELRAGRGDVAAGGLTITDRRQKLVTFTKPYIPDVREIVVSGPGAPPIKTLDDLSGRKVWVRAGSSYADHLRSLSTRLTASGASPIEVIEAPDSLATEDILEMVNSGIFKLTVADQHIATPWAGVLTDLQVHENLAVHSGGSIAWAVRKNNPELRASLDAFIGKHKKGTLLGNILFNRYFKGSKWIANPIIEDHQERLEQLREVFQKYGKMYGFDWLALGAVGFQESRLDQSRRSKAGAVGIMQMKPSTAADKNVAVTPIDTVDKNVHAGAKYLAFLRDRYFSDPEIPGPDRFDFTLAAYNAGPSRIIGLRREAAEKGYNPNIWFSNVEIVAAARVGSETVRYVANINKYYMAYTMFYRNNLQRKLQIQSLGNAPHN
jgi:membrane-bound lytic murein transglycosylase MltF